MERVRIIISGCVQGIFFRAFVREKALQLGLTGYVRNTEEGKVEILIEGHKAKIDKLIENCKQGPPGASVEKVEVKKELYKAEFKEFRIKY